MEWLPTTVGVDELRVDEADFEVVKHGRLVEVAERCEVILAHQDVGVSQVRQVLRLGVQLVVNVLKTTSEPERQGRVKTEILCQDPCTYLADTFM